MNASDAIDSVDPRSAVATPSAARPTTAEEVDAAVRAAVDAAGHLSAIGRDGRAALLDAIAAQLRAAAEPLVATCVRETGLGEDRVRSELERTAVQLSFLGQVAREGSYLGLTVDHATVPPAGRTPDLRMMNVPIGPIGVFAASNFPFAFSVTGGDTASALAAGCPVVVKGHSSHPQTSLDTFDAIQRALDASGAPEGTVGIVFGRDAGISLVDHPAIRAIGFTGSVAGGRALARRAFERPDPIPFFGELGSVNAFVVSPEAARARAASIAAEVVASFTLGAGQFCTKPGLLFVPHGPDGDALLAAARRATAESVAGFSLNSAIYEDFQRVSREFDGSGSATTVGRAASDDGFAVSSLLVEIEAADFGDRYVQECFGPLAIAVRYADAAQLAALLSRLPGALVGTVHGEPDDELAREALALLAPRCGRLVWNGVPTGVTVAWAMNHGGPWPAAHDAQHSSVGAASIGRWVRPLAWQDAPEDAIPAELRDDFDALPRRIDGELRLPARS